MLTFSDFDLLPQSIKALKKQGIEVPTPIQEQSIPILLDSCDLIGQAQTGSGKTLAFSLPMLEFVEPSDRSIQALVITPTRELANQICEVISGLGESDGVRVMPVYGGRAINPQISRLRSGGIQVLVATPGRLVDLLDRRAVNLKNVIYAVIDEADEMLDKGFAKDVEKILGHLTTDHVTALFSATMPDWVHEASRKHLSQPKIVTVMAPKKDQPKIEHTALTFEASRRMDVLRSLLDQTQEGSSIVFGKTKHGVRKLAKKLDELGYSVGCLQGNMSQNARDKVMQDFRDSRTAVLVATNVAARGLDVDHVELVVNFELPENSELLTHRVGRTGRMGREGYAYTLVADTDEKKWQQLKRGLKNPIRSKSWPVGNLTEPEVSVTMTASRERSPSRPNNRSRRRPQRQRA